MIIPERIKTRLATDRPMTTITLRALIIHPAGSHPLGSPRPQPWSCLSTAEALDSGLGVAGTMIKATLRIPVDVVDSLKEIAPQKGFSGYQPLLKAYISEGLRRDEARYAFGPAARLIAALKRRGVPDAVLDEAARE